MPDIPPGYVRVRAHLRRKPGTRAPSGGDFSAGRMLLFGAVALVLVFGACSLTEGDGEDKTDNAAKATAAPSATASAKPSTTTKQPVSTRPAARGASAGSAPERPTGGVTVTARQSIGLAVRTGPGTGATVATIASGTDLPATCTDTGPTIYGWRGGRSNQWIRVTTDQGTGYAPEAWLQTTEPARDLLPTC